MYTFLYCINFMLAGFCKLIHSSLLSSSGQEPTRYTLYIVYAMNSEFLILLAAGLCHLIHQGYSESLANGISMVIKYRKKW